MAESVVNDRKKLLYDMTHCQPKGKTKFHGGGMYGYILLSELLRVAADRVVVYYDSDKYVSPQIQQLIETSKVVTVKAKEKTLSDCIQEYNVGVFYSPGKSDSYKKLLIYNIPIVLTIHGLRNLEMNRDKTEYLYAKKARDYIKSFLKMTPLYRFLLNKYWKSRLWLFNNDNVHIITVSNHSRDSIIYHYPSYKNDIPVLYSFSTTYSNYENIKPYSEGKYYLIVSANRWLKNAYRAISAFDRLFDNPCFKLDGKVIVLGLSSKTSIYKKIKNKDRFTLLGYVEQETLESLYKGAYAFVYPSLNEGFGYPPIEAMKYGTPVIASPFASISEICADAVLYANPYSIEEIAFRILELERADTYERCRERGKDRYKVVEKRQIADLNKFVSYLLSFV